MSNIFPNGWQPQGPKTMESSKGHQNPAKICGYRGGLFLPWDQGFQSKPSNLQAFFWYGFSHGKWSGFFCALRLADSWLDSYIEQRINHCSEALEVLSSIFMKKNATKKSRVILPPLRLQQKKLLPILLLPFSSTILVSLRRKEPPHSLTKFYCWPFFPVCAPM